ncbi:MAG: hypothetical protein Q8T08_04335, partial [Ignavibacteria bacterium]|nr:hypothetical protein [Ignavibacteria bacterium]
MGKNIFKNIILFVIVLIIGSLASCTGLRKIEDGKHLFTSYTITYDSIQFLANKNETSNEINKLILIKPNKRFLWMRPFLSLYKMIPETKKDSGTMHWLKYKLGEPPAYYEDLNLKNINLAIENRLQNRGNFLAKSEAITKEKKKTAKVEFIIHPGKYYTLDTILFPTNDEGIELAINNLQNKSLLKQGQIYNLKDFESERNRIESALKERGYYFFENNFLLFTADTSKGERKVKTQLKLKAETPEEAKKAFRFNKIYIYDDYSLSNYHPDTTIIGDYYYISQNHFFKPKTILNAVFFSKDSLYSRKNHYNTLRHAMSLG